MQNLIKKANRYYDTFINQSIDWHFFFDLAIYVKFIFKTDETRKVVDDIQNKRIKNETNLNNYKKEALEELKKASNNLFKIIKKINFFILI